MSLQINESKVTRVLLADGWHDCQGFGLDSYEFGTYHPDDAHSSGYRFDGTHSGGQNGVCATGFVFRDAATGEQVAGPLPPPPGVGGEGTPPPSWR
jgi:hypothetical protein